MRFLAILAITGLELGCGGSALVDSDAQARPADAASVSDTGGGADGSTFGGADATVKSRIDGGPTATGPDAESLSGSCSFFTCPGCCLGDGAGFGRT
jgi:hypothetical protein